MSEDIDKLAVSKVPEISIDMDHWRVLREQADVLVKSGFLPQAVNTPE